jgi:hypothetical protein
MSDEIYDSDGLYYPYINVRDENWLKVSLLYFPHVLRMVPAGYPTNPTAFMRKLQFTRGSRDEPLLGAYSLRSLEADEAVDRLTARLLEDARQDPEFSKRFSRQAVHSAYGKDDIFQVHRGKAPQAFWNELKRLGLMWEGRYRKGNNRENIGLDEREAIKLDDEWITLHPLLGEAFMTTIAIAVAKEKGLEIITDTPSLHRAEALYSEEAAYDMLIRPLSRSKRVFQIAKETLFGVDPGGDTKRAMTMRVAQIVVASNFDVSSLSADDLANMSKNREALFDFRRYLTKKVSEIPRMNSETERERRLQAVATEVIADWRKTVPTFSKFARRFFGIGLLDKSEKVHDRSGEVSSPWGPRQHGIHPRSAYRGACRGRNGSGKPCTAAWATSNRCGARSSCCACRVRCHNMARAQGPGSPWSVAILVPSQEAGSRASSISSAG